MPEAVRSSASSSSSALSSKRVVVVIPAYNAERTLPRCLESIQKSTLKPLAVVVVDDCSKDKTVETASKYPCTVVKMPANGGQAKGRNYGVEKAPDCDFYCFIDADVVVHPDTIGKLVEAVASKADRAAASVVYEPITPGEDMGFCGHYKNLYASHKWGGISGATTLLNSAAAVVRASVFKEVGGFNETMRAVEDQDLATKISDKYEVWLDGRGATIPQVVHLRPHGFWSLTKDSFGKGVWNVVYFFSRKPTSHGKDAKNLHVLSFPFFELLNIFVGPAIVAAGLASLMKPQLRPVVLGLAAFYWLTRASFLAYIFKKGGLLMGLWALPFTIWESTVCFFALLKGLTLVAGGRRA